jgi:hypothetical protein
MRKIVCVSLLLLATLCPAIYARSSHHSSSSSSKSVHVREYTRKDGTVVRAHDRSAPGTAPAHEPATLPSTPPAYAPSSTPASHHRTSYRPDYIAEGFTPHATVQRDSHGRIKRSEAAKNAFKHQQPCPSTGRTSGRCPGYVIDHVNPLECGGADAPSNMQWQTVADGKAKDKTERFCR